MPNIQQSGAAWGEQSKLPACNTIISVCASKIIYLANAQADCHTTNFDLAMLCIFMLTDPWTSLLLLVIAGSMLPYLELWESRYLLYFDY